MFIFFINSNIFHHLKLEIALAIPATNDEKYNWSNSAGQGLRARVHSISENTCRFPMFPCTAKEGIDDVS